MPALDPDQIGLFLQEAAKPKRGARGPRKDVTEPRDTTVWYKLPHRLANFVDDNGTEVVPHCENPDCTDPRPTDDRGRNIVAMVKGKMMCRYCFLAGWLSDGIQ